MTLLLDTHVLVWLSSGSTELALAQRELIDAAARDGTLLVSAISFWEVAMLVAKGRLTLAQPVSAWRVRTLSVAGLQEIAINSEIAVAAAGLPGDLHGDPADRLLVATARNRNATLMTRDARLLEYGAQGHLAAVAA